MQTNDALMMRQIWLPPRIPSCVLSELYSFTLSLAAGFVIIPGSLKRNPQKHTLLGLQYNPSHA